MPIMYVSGRIAGTRLAGVFEGVGGRALPSLGSAEVGLAGSTGCAAGVESDCPAVSCVVESCAYAASEKRPSSTIKATIKLRVFTACPCQYILHLNLG